MLHRYAYGNNADAIVRAGKAVEVAYAKRR